MAWFLFMLRVAGASICLSVAMRSDPGWERMFSITMALFIVLWPEAKKALRDP